jgi:predicted phosphodiesterase
MEGKKPIRVVVMSDTHDLHFKVDFLNLPKADIFIHAGDFTKFSTAPELVRFR